MNIKCLFAYDHDWQSSMLHSSNKSNYEKCTSFINCYPHTDVNRETYVGLLSLFVSLFVPFFLSPVKLTFSCQHQLSHSATLRAHTNPSTHIDTHMHTRTRTSAFCERRFSLPLTRSSFSILSLSLSLYPSVYPSHPLSVSFTHTHFLSLSPSPTRTFSLCLTLFLSFLLIPTHCCF